MSRPRRLLLVLGVLFGLGLVADQVANRTLLAEGSFRGRRVAPYDPPLFHGAQYESLERARGLVAGTVPDVLPVGFSRNLGWVNRPGMELDLYGYDWAGCRDDGEPTLREADPNRRRVAAFGCSFTHGDGVAGHETWGAVLESLCSDLEVLNLGVGGYGLDQALLRQRSVQDELEPDEVWMVLFPAACLRVTTRFRPIVRHWSSALAFKPRFALDADDALELLPNPAHELADVVRLCEDQALFLERTAERDPWIARVPAAWSPRGSSLLHHSAAGRLALTFYENLGREHDAHLGPRDAEAHRLLEAIVRASAADAEARGARFRFLLLPGPTDLRFVDEHGAGYWTALTDDLAALGIEVLDLTAALRSARDAGAELFLGDGHYNAAGNREVGEALATALSDS